MDWTTKDSGERIGYASGMQRDVDTDKPRFDLIVPELQPYDQQMLTRWARLMARGAEKYGDRNWERACTHEEMMRFDSSAYRHFMQWFCGENDEDHAAAVFFNIQGSEYTRTRIL